ncbi:GNAT family N-acetyltransferase [Nonomuraea sp. KC401]|uniref:GNAT family N-acetyltransferase n=1 Tax=unclassified Nonomuraea TaxID=2593643 RepID=UPI0010FD4C56|nr:MULTISPECIES: GNAT family protein [unclassified Nonomuraea]NBE94254.1 GNAT family N-acetyltransferase [Nonomuraea sp. K271]TLF66069.1 GNAT family N-acetyltransferase [Nonomuraea sp. KC401]
MRNWPLFDLSITTPRLELRLPSLDDLDELADRAAQGIHEAGFMPFMFPWSDADPAERARSTLQYHFRAWGSLAPEKWSIDFVVVYDGQVVGTQGLMATSFSVTREVGTGSWLGQRFHGKGIGTEMRRAVLHLAFAGLEAHHATTEAFEDNHASLAVTRKLGYQEDGITVHDRQGKPAVTRRFRLAREDWAESPGYEIHNLPACLPLLGLTS